MAPGSMRQKLNGISGLVFHDAEIVIFPAAKAARSSIVRTLAELYMLPGDENWKRSVAKLKDRGDVDLSGYYKIGVCRSPWTRLQSIWVEKMIERKRPRRALIGLGFYHRMPFPTFIKMACRIPDDHTEKHLRSQYRTLYQRGELNTLIKFEELGAGWDYIQKLFMERAGRKIPPLQKLNMTKRKKPNWTPHLLDLVQERYEQDIHLLGYERP